MGCESFVLSIRTQFTFNDLMNLKHLLDFSKLKENQELFSSGTRNVVGKYKKMKLLKDLDRLIQCIEK